MLQFSRWSANKPQWKITSCISPRLKRQLQWKLSQLLYDVKSLSRPPTHDGTPRNPGQLVTPLAKWFTRKLLTYNKSVMSYNMICYEHTIRVIFRYFWVHKLWQCADLYRYFADWCFDSDSWRIFMYFAVIQTQDVMSYKLNWNVFIRLSKCVVL